MRTVVSIALMVDMHNKVMISRSTKAEPVCVFMFNSVKVNRY